MEELSGLLTKLKMDHLEAQMDTLCEQAAQRELDYQSFLVEALRAEWQGCSLRGIETRLRLARFPWVKTLEQFDFDFQPSLDHRHADLRGQRHVLAPPNLPQQENADKFRHFAVFSPMFATLPDCLRK